MPIKPKSEISMNLGFFSKDHIFEAKIRNFTLLLRTEVDNTKNSKVLREKSDALIMLDTLAQLIENLPYDKWCFEARKILSSINDSRARALADEIDNAIPPSSYSLKK